MGREANVPCPPGACVLGSFLALAVLAGCGGPPPPRNQPDAHDKAAEQPAEEPAGGNKPGDDAEAFELAKPSKFAKGQILPVGLSDEDLYEYNRAQGYPIQGAFTLEQAFEGDAELADEAAGELTATLDTDMGSFDCTLLEDEAPLTVANFVGLARGTRPTYDKKTDEWHKKPYYDGVLFYRVIEGFMVQTGDATGSGKGTPGYAIVDEIDEKLRHKRAGTLSMANRGPNTGSSQFFVTVKKTPHLDGKHTIFGRCDPKVAREISKVKVIVTPTIDHRPVTPVKLESVKIWRKS